MIIVDRFEGDFAVCEKDGEMTNISKSMLSSDISEGDVIELNGELYIKCHDKIQERKKQINLLMDKIRQKK